MASAQATQVVTIRYPYDAPDRLKDGMREVTLSTEEAVQLYEDLRRALFE